MPWFSAMQEKRLILLWLGGRELLGFTARGLGAQTLLLKAFPSASVGSASPKALMQGPLARAPLRETQ